MRRPWRDDPGNLAAPSLVRPEPERTPAHPRFLRPPRYARAATTGWEGSAAARAIVALVVTFVLVLLVYLLSLSSRPVISNLAPRPNSETPPGPVTIKATVNSNAQPIQRVVMTIDGSLVEPAVIVQNDHVWVVTFTAVLRRGKHEVRVEMIDEAGKRNGHAWSFTAAGPRLAPTVTFAGPAPGDSLPDGLIRIAAEVISEGDVVRAELRLNDETIPTFLTPDPESATRAQGARAAKTWTLFAEPTLAPGSYTARIIVEDVYGSTTEEVMKFAVVDDPAEASARFVAETGQYMRNPFKAFWEAHDGATIFGRPLSPEFVDDRGITVQYYERARLEQAPDGTVILGLLGREALPADTEPVEAPNNPAFRYFPETGHTLAGKFREFWEQHGGIPIFGFPITEEMDEAGVRVQYFERARLELRPNSDGTGMEVKITPLGEQMWRQRRGGQ